VKADLRLRPDLGHQRLHPGLGAGQHERPGRVDHVHALRAGVHHDPRLPGQLGRAGAMAEHEEPDGLHAQVTGSPKMLNGYVGLGAVRSDAGDRRAHFVGVPQILDGAEPRQQQHGDPGAAGFRHRGRDEIELIAAGEPVVEAGPAQAVAVADLDHLDVASVQGMHDRPDLPLGELVRHRVRAVPQG
jgi:hypothetical protein